jgi:MFS family permease
LGILASAIALKFLPSTPSTENILKKLKRVDYVGTLMIVAATICLLLPLQYAGNGWDWSSPFTVTLLCLSFCLFGIFIFVELRAESPIINLQLFRDQTVSALLAISFCLGVCFFTLMYYLPSFFQLVGGDNAMYAGFHTIPLVVGVSICSIGSGQLISRTGYYKYFFFMGPCFLGVGLALIATLNADTRTVQKIFYLLMAGIGVGCLLQSRILSIQASVPKSKIPVATSTANFLLNLGGTLGITVSGSIFSNELKKSLTSEQIALVHLDPLQAREIGGVIQAYSDSLGKTWYFIIPFAFLVILLGILTTEYQVSDKSSDLERPKIMQST